MTRIASSPRRNARPTMDRRPVIVGLDGSGSARAALSWAVDDARARQAPVQVVRAFGPTLAYGPIVRYGDALMPDSAAAQASSEDLVADAVRGATATAPDVEISGMAIHGDAASALVGLTPTASTLVLGSRHLGTVGSVLLGSVTAAVSARASCPVVVVRGSYVAAEDRTAGVVVGVDALRDGVGALEYAFNFACRHAVPLHPVLCWHPDMAGGATGQIEAVMLARCEARLAESLAGWREDYPDVDVHPTVIRNHPVAGLVAASAGRRLLVVGSRGRGPFTSALLGSVSQGVLHHAPCPVAVVKADSDD